MDVTIEQLRRGDGDAWNKAYPVLRAIGINVCLSFASKFNHQEQEDLAVESITKLKDYFDRIQSFDECKKLLVTITKNHIRDRYRQLASVKRGEGTIDSLEIHEGYDPADPDQLSPALCVEQAERALMVAEALKRVPEQYRKVLEDTYFKGLTQQEIAERHGMKLGSIGVYLDRGLKACFKLIPKNLLMFFL